MKTHEIKTWTEFFDDVATGKKPFEYRRDDRGYEVGDRLKLMEFRQASCEFTGRFCEATITYVMRAGRNTAKIGLPDGYCVLGIKVDTTDLGQVASGY